MYNPNLGVHKDDHPSSWVHYKFALDILCPLIKNNSKPKSNLTTPEIITNAQEWTSFYKSKEKVGSLKLQNEWELEIPPIKWLMSGKRPDHLDTSDYNHIFPKNII